MELSKLIDAGKIVNTHGVRGEVKIEVWLDSAELLRTSGRVIIDGREHRLLSAREQKGWLLAKLEGVDDVNAAMDLKEHTVQVYRSDLKLPAGTVFVRDILGAKVVTEEGETVGTLVDALEYPAHMVYVVRGETEHLIPAVPTFIRAIDTQSGTVTVHLIEGM